VFAFILRGTTDVGQVMVFQFALLTGIPSAFVVNRYLVGERFGFAHLYALGVILCGAVMLGMTFLPSLTQGWLIGMGFLMGLATGLHWSNRFYLSLVCTRDDFRNFYFGIESFFCCISSVVMPAAVGLFIVWWGGPQSTAEGVRGAYQCVGAALLALILAGISFLLRGSYPAEQPAVTVPGRYPRLWRKLLLMAALKGTVQIFLMTAPAVLIMRVLGGQEGALGLVQSVGAVVAAVLLYVIGRTTRPQHRVTVLAFALVLYGFGASVNAVFFNGPSVLLFMACQLLALPMLDLAYNPILLSVLDAVAGNGRQSRYAYIVNHEVGVFAGRVVGAAAFILMSHLSTGDAAFRYVLALMSLLHLLCWPIASSIRRDIA
jgi:YQGE family putative transporter